MREKATRVLLITHHSSLITALFFFALPAEALAVAAGPRVAAHVVAALLPEARPVFGEEAHALDPLRGLPRVEPRDDEAHGAAVLGRYGPAVVRPREERIFGEEVLDGEVRRPVVIVAFGDDELRLGPDARQLGNRPREHARPEVVETRPARDAVEVCVDLRRGQLQELVERPLEGAFDEPADLELPGLRVNARRAVRVEHGPLSRARLTGRHAVLAPRVGADDYVPALELIRAARLALLSEGVFEKRVEKTHC